MVWFTVVSVHCLVCLFCPQWSVLVCSSVHHKVTMALSRRCLDASDFSRWTWVYSKQSGAHMRFWRGRKKGCQLMRVLLSRINTEFLYLGSLVLKVLFIQTSAILLQELQCTKHSECLGDCPAYFLFIISLSFSRFHTSCYQYSLYLEGFFTFVAFVHVCPLHSSSCLELSPPVFWF